MFGPLTDREAYAALMAADATPFVTCVNALADTLLTEGVRAVLVDAAEGYNPVHDVCHTAMTPIATASTTIARAGVAIRDIVSRS